MLVRIKKTGKYGTAERITSKMVKVSGDYYFGDEYEEVSFWVRIKDFFSQLGWLRHAR